MTETVSSTRHDARWWILAVLAVAQLMIVVDATIVNVALPSAEKALHISTADRQWVVTAYTLTFGGLLLLGGRIADYTGRKRALMIGLAGFAAASALGGLSPNASMLFASRALQGIFAALLAPAALSLLNVTFTEAHERARAFGVYGAIAGGGAALGLILGGVLTQFVSWRWCLLVNTPIAIVTAVAALRIIPESRNEERTRYDLPGAITSTGGMIALVYGFTEASTKGWGSAITLGILAAGVILLSAFVMIEMRSRQPILPLRVLLERNRGGSYLAMTLLGMGMMGAFLFLTFYLQQSLHYSALKTGFAYLPFSLGIITGAGVASRMMTVVKPRILMALGAGLAALGMLWFTQIGAHSEYWLHIALAEIVMSFGMGLVFVPVNGLALTGVEPHDAGVASALVNATQQVGGSLGTALLNTVATTATATYIAAHGPASSPLAAIHGYAVAFTLAAGFLAVAVVAIVAMINQAIPASPSETAGEAAVPTMV